MAMPDLALIQDTSVDSPFDPSGSKLAVELAKRRELARIAATLNDEAKRALAARSQ
jgi:hypothetical protein